MSYLSKFTLRRTPQSEPIPGSTQVPNSAGGFAWAVDDWTRLRRFLILGSEGGSFYTARADADARERDRRAGVVEADGARAVAADRGDLP